MAEHKPIFGSGTKGLFGKRGNKAQDKMAREKEARAQEREREADITYAINDLRVTLNMLNRKYENIFDRELTIARRNAAKRRKDSRNYSRIGIAFYSRQVVTAAMERLDELSSSFEISTAMNELSSALRLVNELPGMVGKVSAKDLLKSASRMDKAAGGNGGDLAETLSSLANLSLEGMASSSTEGLVSADEIERWIEDRSYADECLENGTGGEVEGEDFLEAASHFASEKSAAPSSLNDSLERLRQAADSL